MPGVEAELLIGPAIPSVLPRRSWRPPANGRFRRAAASGVPGVSVQVLVPMEGVARNGYPPTLLAVAPVNPLRAPHQAASHGVPQAACEGRFVVTNRGSHRKDEPIMWQGLWRWIWLLYGALALIATLLFMWGR